MAVMFPQHDTWARLQDCENVLDWVTSPVGAVFRQDQKRAGRTPQLPRRVFRQFLICARFWAIRGRDDDAPVGALIDEVRINPDVALAMLEEIGGANPARFGPHCDALVRIANDGRDDGDGVYRFAHIRSIPFIVRMVSMACPQRMANAIEAHNATALLRHVENDCLWHLEDDVLRTYIRTCDTPAIQQMLRSEPRRAVHAGLLTALLRSAAPLPNATDHAELCKMLPPTEERLANGHWLLYHLYVHRAYPDDRDYPDCPPRTRRGHLLLQADPQVLERILSSEYEEFLLSLRGNVSPMPVDFVTLRDKCRREGNWVRRACAMCCYSTARQDASCQWHIFDDVPALWREVMRFL